MIVVFFLVGAGCGCGQDAGHRGLRGRLHWAFLLAAVTVAVYIGTTLPTYGFGAGFNFAEPAVVTQNWTNASVALGTR